MDRKTLNNKIGQRANLFLKDIPIVELTKDEKEKMDKFWDDMDLWVKQQSWYRHKKQ